MRKTWVKTEIAKPPCLLILCLSTSLLPGWEGPRWGYAEGQGLVCGNRQLLDHVYMGSTSNFCPSLRPRNRPALKKGLVLHPTFRGSVWYIPRPQKPYYAVVWENTGGDWRVTPYFMFDWHSRLTKNFARRENPSCMKWGVTSQSTCIIVNWGTVFN